MVGLKQEKMKEKSRKESYTYNNGVVSGLPKYEYAPPKDRCPESNLGCWNGEYVKKCSKKKELELENDYNEIIAANKRPFNTLEDKLSEVLTNQDQLNKEQ